MGFAPTRMYPRNPCGNDRTKRTNERMRRESREESSLHRRRERKASLIPGQSWFFKIDHVMMACWRKRVVKWRWHYRDGELSNIVGCIMSSLGKKRVHATEMERGTLRSGEMILNNANLTYARLTLQVPTRHFASVRRAGRASAKVRIHCGSGLLFLLLLFSVFIFFLFFFARSAIPFSWAITTKREPQRQRDANQITITGGRNIRGVLSEKRTESARAVRTRLIAE